MLVELSVQEDHFDFALSIASALTNAENEYQELNEQIQESLDTLKKITPECDKLDYILSGTCGALCGVIDIFLVGKPGESPVGNITDVVYEALSYKYSGQDDVQKDSE